MPGLADNPHHKRHRLATLLGIVSVLVVMSNVGSIFAPSLVNDHPELLLLLSSRNRHLLFTVGAGIGVVPYVLIASLRLTAAAVPFFLLGRWYGDSGLRWLERQAGGTPATIRWIENGFRKAGDVILFFMVGSNLVCLLSGSSHRSARRFAGVLAAGIAARLAFFWVMGKAFQSQLESILDWIQRYQWWLVVAFFLLTMAQSFRRGASTVEEVPPHEIDDDPTADTLDPPATEEPPAGEPERA